MSQDELAKKVGVSQSAITKYENGSQIPSYQVACEIFKELILRDRSQEPDLYDIMQNKIISLQPNDKLQKALEIMKEHSISQIPIKSNTAYVGSINESKILELLSQYHDISQFKSERLEQIMDEPLPIIPGNAKIGEVTELLKKFGGILVSKKGVIEGIVTKADLLDL